MRRFANAALLTLLAVAVSACVNQHEMRKRDIQHFLQTASGEYNNEAGDRLVLVPVYARMIGLDTMYLERTTAKGTSGRLLALEVAGNNDKFVQLSYVFTQQGQWRNLLAQPDATVDLKDGSRPIRARVAQGAERTRLWARFDEFASWGTDLDAYARRRSHETAVVVLEPR